MCLYNTQLNLTWDKKEGCYVGYGYKAVIAKSLAELKSNYSGLIPVDGWYEAVGNGKMSRPSRVTETDDNGVEYWPGFHMFLEQEHAECYAEEGDLIVRVKFAEVTAFGEQSTNVKEEPCVVVRYMKFVKVVGKIEEEEVEKIQGCTCPMCI